MNLRDPKVFIPSIIATLAILSLGGTGIYYLVKDEEKVKINVILNAYLNYHEEVIDGKYDFYLGPHIEQHNFPDWIRSQETLTTGLDIRRKNYDGMFYYMKGKANGDAESSNFVLWNKDTFERLKGAVNDGEAFRVREKFRNDDITVNLYVGFSKTPATYSEFYSYLPTSDNFLVVFRDTSQDFKNVFEKFKEEYPNIKTLEGRKGVFVVYNLENAIIDLY